MYEQATCQPPEDQQAASIVREDLKPLRGTIASWDAANEFDSLERQSHTSPGPAALHTGLDQGKKMKEDT